MTTSIDSEIHVFECQGEHFALNVHTLALVHISSREYLKLKSLDVMTKDLAFHSLLRAVPFLSSTKDIQTDNENTFETAPDKRFLGICLIMTHNCNLKCSYCYDQLNRQFNCSDSIDVNYIKKLLDTSSNNYDTISIWFFGGEPLLFYEKLVQVVECAEELVNKSKNLSIGFSITTNGTLLTESKIKFLYDHGFAILISCDGLDNNSIRQRFPNSNDLQHEREMYVKMLSMVSDIFKLDTTRIAVRSTVTSDNIANILDNYKHLNSMGIKKVFFAPAIELDKTFSMDNANQWKREFEKLVTYVVKSDIISDWSCLPQFQEIIASIKNRKNVKGKCAVLSNDPNHSICAVDANGKMYPCQRLALLGEDSFNVLAEARDKQVFHESMCLHCWARNICGESICPYINKVCSGHAAKPHLPLCDVQQYLIELSCWVVWYQKHNCYQ